MTRTACALLRHDVRPRWIGDLHAMFCHSCGCLWIPEPSDPARPSVPASVTPNQHGHCQPRRA